MLEKSQRVLHWGQEDDDLVMFTNGAHEEGQPETQLWVPSADWSDMGEPRDVTVTIEPGDRLNVGMAGTLAPAGERVEGATESPDRRPHSRACGMAPHEHGVACSANCPTCSGLPRPSVRA